MKKGFSLIELLISLIIISLITAAFLPIITKKTKYQNAIIAGGFGGQNCKKFDPEGRCLACDKDKCIFCSTQAGLNKGQYVNPKDSCEIKTCIEGYAKCSDTAISCLEGYGYNSATKTCTKCAAGSFSKGENQACTSCAADSVSSTGASICSECKAIEHKKPNAAKTACINVTCGRGQYIDGNNCKTCPQGTYQEADNHQLTSCIGCNEGFYCESGNKISCSENCKTCSSNTNCTKCEEGTILSNGKCIKGGDCYVVAYSKICIAKFNAGDPNGLEIPEGLVEWKVATSTNKIREEDRHHRSYLYCWRGNNTNTCDAANGGYSACSRTVCSYMAAKKICEYHGWRLPKRAEMGSFYSYSYEKGMEGLQLCDYNAGYSNAVCTAGYYCPNSYDGSCMAYRIWGEEPVNTNAYITYRLMNGIWSPANGDAMIPASVRCVKDL